MAERMTAVLWSPQQGHQVFAQAWQQAKALLMAGQRLTLDLKPAAKNRQTEEKYHAIIGEIAAQAIHLGSKWDDESWKRLLLDKFAKETGRARGRVIPSLDGDGVVEVGLLSRKFSQADGSEFIEWLQAWCVENGVELSQ
jgi:hypothetical protein